MSARLIHAVIATESSYRADAVSPKGAIGLMQLLPATARDYGVTDLLDPQQNIHAGTRHLRELLEAFDGDVALALAAYNAGRRAVLRSGGIPPFPETIRYVMRVLQRYGGAPAAAPYARRDPPEQYCVSLTGNQQYTLSLPVPGTVTLDPIPRTGCGAPLRDSTAPKEGERGERRAGWRIPRRSREAAHPHRR